ncbi:MAG: hypothetical protein GF398_19810 [Chitinivibrionales bacterium]|nr:hypothetical protein [Chitinivibrionales bacterium]
MSAQTVDIYKILPIKVVLKCKHFGLLNAVDIIKYLKENGSFDNLVYLDGDEKEMLRSFSERYIDSNINVPSGSSPQTSEPVHDTPTNATATQPALYNTHQPAGPKTKDTIRNVVFNYLKAEQKPKSIDEIFDYVSQTRKTSRISIRNNLMNDVNKFKVSRINGKLMVELAEQAE